MIDLKGASIFVEGYGASAHPLQDLTFHFADRGFYFLVEKPDAGRNTLLKTIGGLAESDFNSVLASPGTSFSYVFHNDSFLPSLSLRENLELFETDEKKIEEALEAVGLSYRLHDPLSAFTKGEKTRLALARALLSHTNVILLDEPGQDLDEETAKRIYELLSSVSKDKLVILETEDEAAAKCYGDVILRLGDGKLESEEIKPLPEGGPLAMEAKNDDIPWKIKRKYALQRLTTNKVRFGVALLFLVLAQASLLIGFNFAFFDSSVLALKAAENADGLFYDLYQQKTGSNISIGKPLTDTLASYGIEPNYEVEGWNNGVANYRLILADAMTIKGVAYTPQDGQVINSDFLDETFGLKIGDGMDGVDWLFKDLGITIGQEAKTGYETAKTHFPDDSEGDAHCQSLLRDSYEFSIINTNTYLSILEKYGISMWNFAIADIEDGYGKNPTVCFLASEAPHDPDTTPSVLYGAYPSAADEIMVDENIAWEITGSSDLASAVGKSLPVQAYTHDYYQMSEHFSSLKVCGVLSGAEPDCFYASEAFFETLKNEAKYEANCLLDKENLIRYVEEGRPDGIGIMGSYGSDPLESTADVADYMQMFRGFYLTLGIILALISFPILLDYSADVIRRRRKDVATLKFLGKSNVAITSIFFLADIFFALLALALALLGGSAILLWVGASLESKEYFTFNPMVFSGWAYLILVVASLLLPLLVVHITGNDLSPIAPTEFIDENPDDQ